MNVIKFVNFFLRYIDKSAIGTNWLASTQFAQRASLFCKRREKLNLTLLVLFARTSSSFDVDNGNEI